MFLTLCVIFIRIPSRSGVEKRMRPAFKLIISYILGCYSMQVQISIVQPPGRTEVSNIFTWSNTLHVSDGLSVHHQEFKTVHTATGICQADTADCLLASSQQCLLHIRLLLYVQS